MGKDCVKDFIRTKEGLRIVLTIVLRINEGLGLRKGQGLC